VTPTLERTFDSGANALNLVRFVLASMVILGHAADLSGVQLGEPLALLLSEVPVDGFFAVSGFLIARSWHRSPVWRDFLQHRLLRIAPAYLVCLLVTGLAIAPLATVVSGRSLEGYWSASDGPLSYFLRNVTLWVGQYQISGGPTRIPVPLNWDGSLWTLGWEFLCYLGLGLIGALGLLSMRRHFMPWMFAGIWLVNAFGAYADARGLFPTVTGRIEPADRFALMFTAGTLLYTYQERVPMCRSLALASGLLVACGLLLTSDYRLLAGLPLAYLVIWIGAALPLRLGSRNDLSYGMYIYSFPIQQGLVMSGAAAVGLAGFAVLGLVATLPVAALSWLLIERPSLHRKRRTPDVEGAVTTAPIQTTALIMALLFVAYYAIGTLRA
jgi:peptidoglycan/LPS O-acetylase OafA/YrhL